MGQLVDMLACAKAHPNLIMATEADTCRKFGVPLLQAAGWDKVFNRFAFAALRASRQIREQVFGQIRGATRPGYNTTLLGTVELPTPPLPEQHRVVAEVDALQAEVEALKRLLAETATELDALLPAILDRAFKGDLC